METEYIRNQVEMSRNIREGNVDECPLGACASTRGLGGRRKVVGFADEF